MRYWKEVEIKSLLGRVYYKRGIAYSDDIIAFDLEASSGFMKASGDIIPDIPNLSDSYYKCLTPVSLSYIWMLGINDTVLYGRTLVEAVELFRNINDNNVQRCFWVHNLGYDFYFLLSHLKVKQYFARQIKHPLKVVFENLENIEFRCSYMLTRLSLAEWGESLKIEGVQKDTGYEYSKIRTPLTPLDNDEMHYCKMDIVVMLEGLKKELETYKHVHDIPLTQTGKVRKVVKSLLRKRKGWLSKVGEATPTLDLYLKLILAFWGGDVHGIYTKISRVIRELVESWDFESSYPFVMCTAKLPLNPFVKTELVDERLFKNYAFLINVEFENIECNDVLTFIPFSKCQYCSKDVAIDNGRIMSASKISLWCTELDFLTIKEHYHTREKDHLEYNIKEAYMSRKAYLPREYILYVLELFAGKTGKKGIENLEALYRKDKEFVNALYGLMVMYLLMDEITIKKGGKDFEKRVKTREEALEYFDKLIGHANSKNFIPYAAGVWVTAEARRNLWTVLSMIPVKKILYRDTDSVKHIKKGVDLSFVEKWNKICLERIKESAKANMIPVEMFIPKDKDGKPHMIGHLDHDGTYTEFVTHGAKKYMYRSAKDGELHLTMSGVNKKQVYLFNDIADFTNDYVFKRNTKYPSKQVTYCHNPNGIVWNKGKPDEYKSNDLYGVNIRCRDYKSGLSEDLTKLVAGLQERGKSCELFDCAGNEIY